MTDLGERLRKAGEDWDARARCLQEALEATERVLRPVREAAEDATRQYQDLGKLMDAARPGRC